MKAKTQKTSLAETLMKVINSSPRIVEEIGKDLKDNFGYRVQLQDIRVNLLYLLRREKIKRKKEGGKYKYFI
jgi:hypothetical protein